MTPKLIPSIPEGYSSTGLFPTNSIISSRCSGCWQITRCWFCKQFIVHSLSSDISSCERNKWHQNGYGQGRRTSSDLWGAVLCLFFCSWYISLVQTTKLCLCWMRNLRCPWESYIGTTINAYKSLGLCSWRWKGWSPSCLGVTQVIFSDNSRPLSISSSNRFQGTGFLSLNTVGS